jgi:hypothetical protein
MKRFSLALWFASVVLLAQGARAEFRRVDLTIFGMD